MLNILAKTNLFLNCLLGMDNDDELDSFYFKQTVENIEHDYRVTFTERAFIVEKDGELFAELVNNEVWQQIAGELLQPDELEFIKDKIEDHYE